MPKDMCSEPIKTRKTQQYALIELNFTLIINSIFSNDFSQLGDANCVAFESDAHSRVRHPNLPKPTKSQKLNGISVPDCSQLGDGQLRIVRK